MVYIPRVSVGITSDGRISSSTRPQSPSIGDQWIDPSTGRREVWSGDRWVNVAEGITGAFFGTGRDGALVISSGVTLDFNSANVLVKEYESLHIKSGQTLDATGVPSDGGILILRIKRNFDWEGTIDLSSLGADGGASESSGGGQGYDESSKGIDGTRPFNALKEKREGSGGNTSAGNGTSNAVGGGGGASTVTAGTDASGVGGLSAAAGGIKITENADTLAGVAVAMVICSGGGGASGGAAYGVNGPGSAGATSGAGGKGGGSLYIACGGTFNFASGAVVNLSGANGGNGSASASGESGAAAASGGGGGGGGSGVGVGVGRGGITNDGTATVNGGSGGSGATDTLPTGGSATASNGGAGGAGKFLVSRG